VNEYELAIRRQLRQRLIDAVASWPGQTSQSVRGVGQMRWVEINRQHFRWHFFWPGISIEIEISRAKQLKTSVKRQKYSFH